MTAGEVGMTEGVPANRPWWRRGIWAVAVGVGLAAGAAGVAAAATGGSPSPSPSQGSSQGNTQAPRGHGPFGKPGWGHGRFGPGADALHGEFVVPGKSGGYQTIDVQRGTVTAVSTSSLTVRSSDGYSATYTVTANSFVGANRDGIGSVKNGDQIGVLAVKSGGTLTAVRIVDGTDLQNLRNQFGPRRMAPPSNGSPQTSWGGQFGGGTSA